MQPVKQGSLARNFRVTVFILWYGVPFVIGINIKQMAQQSVRCCS